MLLITYINSILDHLKNYFYLLQYTSKMLFPKSSTSQQVPIMMHNESEQAREWSQVFSEDTKKQSIPVIAAWQLNERM